MRRIDACPVLPAESWRDAAAYAGLERVGRRGLAWELLRRDPGYRAAVLAEGAGRVGVDGRLMAASAGFAARWGLHFRRGSGGRCVRRAALLDPRGRSRRS